MRPSHLVIVRGNVLPFNLIPAGKAIDRLTQGHSEGKEGVFLPQEAEVMYRALNGRCFRREHLTAIVHEILRIYRSQNVVPNSRQSEVDKQWRRECNEYVDTALEELTYPDWLDGPLRSLKFHRENAQTVLPGPVRLSFLRAALTAFFITPDPNRTPPDSTS